MEIDWQCVLLSNIFNPNDICRICSESPQSLHTSGNLFIMPVCLQPVTWWQEFLKSPAKCLAAILKLMQYIQPIHRYLHNWAKKNIISRLKLQGLFKHFQGPWIFKTKFKHLQCFSRDLYEPFRITLWLINRFQFFGTQHPEETPDTMCPPHLQTVAALPWQVQKESFQLHSKAISIKLLIFQPFQINFVI